MGNGFKTGIGAGIVALIVAIGVGAYQIASTPPNGGAQPAAGVPTTYTRLTFDDEFSGTTLDTTTWTALAREGDVSNSENQCYSPTQVRESGGALTITAVHLATSLSCSSLNGATGAKRTNTYDYLSGMIQTRTFKQAFGTWEIRMKAPDQQGDWPAFWLLGANCQTTNPQTSDDYRTCSWATGDSADSGEIDVVEIKGSNAAWQNLCVTGSCGSSGSHAPPSGDVSTAYHTYDLVWTPTSCKFYIDGTLGQSYTTSIPSGPMFIIIQYAIGGSGGAGVPTPANYPATTAVQWVRVWD